MPNDSPEFYERTLVSADVWREMGAMVAQRLERELRRSAALKGYVVPADPKLHVAPEPADGPARAYVVTMSGAGTYDPDAAAKIWPPRCMVVTGDGSAEAPYELQAHQH